MFSSGKKRGRPKYVPVTAVTQDKSELSVMNGGRHFTCIDLISLFGGWFTLTHAFTMKDEKGNDVEFYICSQDISETRVNERPDINKAVQRMFNKTVHGFAIIAPASMFGGKE